MRVTFYVFGSASRCQAAELQRIGPFVDHHIGDQRKGNADDQSRPPRRNACFGEGCNQCRGQHVQCGQGNNDSADDQTDGRTRRFQIFVYFGTGQIDLAADQRTDVGQRIAQQAAGGRGQQAVSTAEDLDFIDIPTFLRRQAD